MSESIEERLKHHEFSDRSRNENEKKVAGKILELYGKYPDTCFCHQCLDNMFCVALNELPAKYENAVIHHLLKKNICTEEAVEKAVKDAIRIVHEHPKEKYSEHFLGK